MMVRTALALALAAGCAPGPIGAEAGSTLVVPSGGDFTMDAAYVTAGDGIGLLLSGEIIVLDPEEVPSPGILVEIVSGWSGAYVIPEGAVRVVANYEVSCDGSDDDSCDAFFDVEGQRYVEFAGQYDEVEEFRPGYMADATDDRGILTFYVFIDSVPMDSEGNAEGVTLYVSIGVDAAEIDFTFGE